ncbi:hypothetical protein EXU48_00935 [Occultella glacieicola]|uniref:Uncharacterized protein n=1 Tax=Occultella glacieicola TaxID=2518684 RepID=A0ABY2EA20_9MICO|nr:AAA family ATPase [Occultella glacieicola]TDE98800.1 hypothetical protein EXU48_00935 [Occultella glacieicola]
MRFTLDEWMLRLYPGLGFDTLAYGSRAEQVKVLIWSGAEQVLAAGTDVVLDWNTRSVERRRWAVARARAAGADVVLHKLTTPVEIASARARVRSATGRAFAHPVTAAGNEHLATLMEEPSPDEGMRIVEL